MISISSETQVASETGKTTGRIDLPLTDWHRIHDAALDLHRAPSLVSAMECLARFIEGGNPGSEFSASHLDGLGEQTVLLPAREIRGVDFFQGSSYRAAFEIDLPRSGSIQISFKLPVDVSIRDQTKLELLLEHLSVAAQHLPLLPPD